MIQGWISFQFGKAKWKRYRINTELKEFENPFEHDEIVNTEKCGEKKYYIFFNHFFVLPFFL
jgi:hypothetical protein